MKKIVFIIFIAIFPGLIGGCFGQKSEETATTQNPAPTASPTPAPAPPFGQSTQPGTTTGTNIDITGLIPSTPPSQVPIEQGRSNPFAILPVKPTITVDPTKIPVNSQPVNPTSPTGSNTPPTSATPRTSTTPQTGSTTRTAGNSRPSQSPTVPGAVPRPLPPSPVAKAPIAPPPLPEPTEARAVYVSGVVSLPTRPMAIVKAPGETVERAVMPGTFLANGRVRVKAIYAYSDNPVVILEQYGIEVAKRVGEAPIEAKPEQQASANSEQS